MPRVAKPVPSTEGRFVRVTLPAQDIAVELPPRCVQMDADSLETYAWLDISGSFEEFVNDLVRTKLAELERYRQQGPDPVTGDVVF